MSDASHDGQGPGPVDQEPGSAESPGHETDSERELEERLAEPVLKGLKGLDTAQVAIACFLIVAAGLIAYSNAFSLPFQYEDRPARAGEAGGLAIGEWNAAQPLRYPSLPLLTLALTQALAPANAVAFHAVNILLHLANALLVYLLGRRLLRQSLPETVPMLAGLLFVLHPANTESVNYLVGRSVLLAALFTLAALALFLRAVEQEDAVRVWPLIGSILAFVLAWACDFAALLVPSLILGADWVVNGKGLLKRLPVHAAYWALLPALLAAHVAAGGPADDASDLFRRHADATLSGRAEAFLRGLHLTVSPTTLTVYPDVSDPELASAPGAARATVTLALSFLAAMAIVAAYLVARRAMAGLALAWCAAALVLAASPLAPAAHFTTPGRGLYFACVGAVLIVPWLFASLLTRPLTRLVGGVAAAVLLVAAGAGVYLRNRVWQDERTLWEDAAAKAPRAALPYRRMGALSQAAGLVALREAVLLARDKQGPAAAVRQEAAQTEFVAAERRLRQAVELNPEDADSLYRLGVTLGLLRKRQEALDTLLKALRLDPANFDYTLEIATLIHSEAAGTGDADAMHRAIDYFRRASALRELPPDVRATYAHALAAIGDLETSERELRSIAGEDESSPVAAQWRQVQNTLRLLAGLDAESRELLRQDPDSPEGLRLTAQALLGRGQTLKAVYLLDRLLARHPDDGEVWALMGTARAQANDEARFLEEWPDPPRASRSQGRPSLWLELARRCASVGRWAAAQRYLEFAAGRTPDVSMPLLELGRIALEFKALPLASQYFEQAATAYPESPAPWIGLCDIALDSENLPAARGYLAQAERRGADPAAVAERRARAGEGPAEHEREPFQTILR